MVDLSDMRAAEYAKYERAYRLNPNYRMKNERLRQTARDILKLPARGAFLDIACGRGEMLRHALALGFDPVRGTEIVDALIDGERVVRAEAHALPFGDKSFDVVTMFDVIEHLVRPDDDAACREMARVARCHVLITANNRPSFNKVGDDLHINKRPYSEWDRLFRCWFSGRVTWLPGERVSPAWRIDL